MLPCKKGSNLFVSYTNYVRVSGQSDLCRILVNYANRLGSGEEEEVHYLATVGPLLPSVTVSLNRGL